MKQQSPYILVAAIDGSDISQAVLEHALDLAGHHPEHELHVVRAVDSSGATARRSERQQEMDAAHRTLEREVEFALTSMGDGQELGRWRVRTHVVAGAPEDEIAALAADVRAHLILLGRHGEQGRHRRFAGSVPERLLRVARCPVLVVQPPAWDGAGADPGAESDDAVSCPDCQAVRSDSGGETWFCEEHSGRWTWRSSMWRPNMPTHRTRGGSVWF